MMNIYLIPQQGNLFAWADLQSRISHPSPQVRRIARHFGVPIHRAKIIAEQIGVKAEVFHV